MWRIYVVRFRLVVGEMNRHVGDCRGALDLDLDRLLQVVYFRLFLLMPNRAPSTL